MKFRYKKFLLPERSALFGSSLLKPILPVEIAYGAASVRYEALVDSGADFSIFDAEIGEYLGLDVRAGTPLAFGGIQERGGATAYIHEVRLRIGGHAHTVPVGFSPDIATQGFGVLGQKGFFDLFVVKFDLQKEEIELKIRALTRNRTPLPRA